MQNFLLQPNPCDQKKKSVIMGGGEERAGKESKYSENYTLGFQKFFFKMYPIQVSREADQLLQKR